MQLDHSHNMCSCSLLRLAYLYHRAKIGPKAVIYGKLTPRIHVRQTFIYDEPITRNLCKLRFVTMKFELDEGLAIESLLKLVSSRSQHELAASNMPKTDTI